jgi:hypothetical protein
VGNSSNHPYLVRTGAITQDSYFWVIGFMLGLPPNKACIREMPKYDSWVKLTSLGINRL